VWSQGNGSNDQIFKSEYRNGAWSHPSSFSDNISPDGTWARKQRVAMDNSGNAIIVWEQLDGSSILQIFKSEYRNGAWSHPSSLSDNISLDSSSARKPQVAMDNNGNAIIVWRQYDGSSYGQIFLSEYRNGTWSHPNSLSDNISPDGSEAVVPQVAMDNNGNAIIMWRQYDGSSYMQIFLSEYRNGTWNHPDSLSDNIGLDGSDASGHQIAMDDNGNAIAAWRQLDGLDDQIFLSEYRNGTWNHPDSRRDNISPDGEPTESPVIAMNENGDAIVVWGQSDGSDIQLYMSEYRNGTWNHPDSLADNISIDGKSSYNYRVAMNNEGETIIAWRQYNRVFISEYIQFVDSESDGMADRWEIQHGLDPSVNDASGDLDADGITNIIEYWSGCMRPNSPDSDHDGVPDGVEDLNADGVVDPGEFDPCDEQSPEWDWIHPSSFLDYISPDGSSSRNAPQVAMDNNGNAIIVWGQYDSSSDKQIFLSEYRNGTWNHPDSISDNISPDGNPAYSPKVAMDNNGNAIIVWSQYDGSSKQIFLSEYRDSTWSHPNSLSDNISLDGSTTTGHQVSMDNNGNAIIVWSQYDGSSKQIFLSEYRNGTWSHPNSLSDNISPDGETAISPQVAMDSNGNAIIVWSQYYDDNSYYRIFLSEYRNGTWIHPSSLSDYISLHVSGSNATSSQVSMDSNGNAIVVWQRGTSSNKKIFLGEYREGEWLHPISVYDNISPDGGKARYPKVAVDDNGNAIVVWSQSDSSNYHIFMSEYRNGEWLHPISVYDNISPDVGDATYPQVAVDDNGNAIVVWSQSDDSDRHIFISERRRSADIDTE
jgi:mRNA-degrading endonuclease HigB of HigAB toxin-antitoxin module